MKTQIVDWFISNYSNLYEQMKLSDHTHSNGSKNPYHLEGDVWTHTMMVLDLVDEDVNHIFAALLHDIGKVSTRHEKTNGRVAFRYHENVSMVKSIDILKHASTEFNVNILLVLQLVAWHGTLWNKSPVSEKIKTLDLCYGHQPELLKELISFVEADAFGRDYAAEVNDDLDFVSDQFEHLHNYIPFNKQQYREKRPLDAVFLIGISGSGKSTYIENRFADYDIISVDNFFYSKHNGYGSVDYKKNIHKAHNQSMKDLLSAVKNRRNILVDMTNLSKETRGKKLVKIPSTQYNYKAVVFLVGENQIEKNLKSRDHKKLNESILNKQISQFELPNYDEFDEIEYVFEYK